MPDGLPIKNTVKGKVCIAGSQSLTATGCHLPYGLYSTVLPVAPHKSAPRINPSQ